MVNTETLRFGTAPAVLENKTLRKLAGAVGDPAPMEDL